MYSDKERFCDTYWRTRRSGQWFICTVWVKKSPLRFSENFFQTVGNFNLFFTHLLHDPFYTRLQIFIQISPTLTKLCHTKRDHSANVCLLGKWRHCWRHIISNMFVDIIKAADLGWLATDNDQQSYQRLTQTSERMRFGRWWTFWAYYVNWVVTLNMA